MASFLPLLLLASCLLQTTVTTAAAATKNTSSVVVEEKPAVIISSSSLHVSSGGHEDDCKGQLRLDKFTRLDRICQDCYELYKELEVYKLCRADCFGTKVFDSCLESLQVSTEVKEETAAFLEEANSKSFHH